jgi:hypothetical protein
MALADSTVDRPLDAKGSIADRQNIVLKHDFMITAR